MRTGNLIRRVRPYDHPWETGLKGEGSSTATFKTDDAEHPLTNVAATFRPNARGLAVLWGDVVEYAGKIESWAYDRDAQNLAVSTVEIRAEMLWRLTYGVNVYEQGTLSIVAKSAAGAVRAILARAMQWSSEWALPIDLPADTAGLISQTWEFWRKLRISDLLQQIEEEGYEIYFRPRKAGNQIRFETIVSSRIRLGRTTFMLQAAELPIDHISYTVDGSIEVTGVQVLGDGMEQDQKVAWAGSTTGQDIIIRDTKKAYPDLVGTRLQQATNAGLAEDQDPLVQWSVGRFLISEEWSSEHALPGRGWAIYSKGDVIIPDGTHELRVISSRGNVTSNAIEVEVQRAA
jgi:hypothetical protein